MIRHATGNASEPDWPRVKGCVGRTEAASLDKVNRRPPGASGIRRLVGLCSQHHTEQEQSTERFNATYGLDLDHEGIVLANRWDDR